MEPKAKTQQLPYIPEAIVLEILSRLPVHSLLRFTIISKSWRCSILDPKFSLSSTPTTIRQRVLITSRWSSDRNDRERVSLHTMTAYNELATVEKLPHQLIEHGVSFDNDLFPKHGLDVMGSCNGLLLVAIREHLFLWNTYTRCCKLVLAYDRLRRNHNCDTVRSGLCYDSSARNYKAVLALAPNYPLDSDDREFVVVGDFRNRTWTEVRFPYSVGKLESGPVANEVLHWLVSNRVIVCFVPETNEFVDLPMPQYYEEEEENSSVLGLGVLEGCLCMVGLDQGNVEVLAMKEHGVKKSWTRMFVLCNFGRIGSHHSLVPLCWTKDGHEVVMVFAKRFLMAFNLRENSHRSFREPEHGHLQAVVWEESLVSHYVWIQ